MAPLFPRAVTTSCPVPVLPANGTDYHQKHGRTIRIGLHLLLGTNEAGEAPKWLHWQSREILISGCGELTKPTDRTSSQLPTHDGQPLSLPPRLRHRLDLRVLLSVSTKLTATKNEIQTPPNIVPIPQAVPPGCAEQPYGGALPVKLCVASVGEAQRARNRGANIARGAADSPYDCAQRERARPHRAQRQQRPHQHQDQAGRRDRAHPGPQVYALPDPARGIFLYPEEEAHQGSYGEREREMLRRRDRRMGQSKQIWELWW